MGINLKENQDLENHNQNFDEGHYLDGLSNKKKESERKSVRKTEREREREREYMRERDLTDSY